MRERFEVTYLDPDESGVITPDSVKSAIQDNTVLVSIMHINNELGTVNDIEKIGEVTRKHGAFFMLMQHKALEK